MARLPRIDLAGVPQHILQRGNNRSPCFFEAADYVFYLDCLQQAAPQHDCVVYAYVLMTNHVHLLVSGAQVGGVSAMMQTLGRRYVRGRKNGVIAPRALCDVVRCCTRDEGRPFAVGLQGQTANHLKLLWPKAMVVSVEEKAYEICQVWIMKVSAERTNVRIENF